MATNANTKVALSGLAVVAGESLVAATHAGGVAAIVALAAGAVVYNVVADIEKLSGRDIPSLPTPTRAAQPEKQPNKQSLAYRLLNGKSVRASVSTSSEQVADSEYSSLDVASDFDVPQLHNGKFTFSQLLASGWLPSTDKIFLARLEDGTDVFVSVDQLVHIALAGSTRQGKTSIIRELLLQLCYVGATCILLDPHYTPYDIETDEDWTPFTPYLRFNPLECKSYDKIEQILHHAATTLLDKRKVLREQMKPVGKPAFLIVDELPAIVAERPDVQKYIAKLLREGAKYKIYLCVASQDFQVKTVSPQSGGAIRDNYKTCLYVGGDTTTARVLLDCDVEKSVESTLGQGPVYLRCASQKQAALARTPFTDNYALYQLLGPSTYQGMQDDALTSDDGDIYTETPYQYGDGEVDTEKHMALPELIKRDTRRKAEDIDIKVAITLWNAGFNSRAKLAKALDIAENQAGKLIGNMEAYQASDGRMDG